MNYNDNSIVCPATLALNLIARKWSLHILRALVQTAGQPIRFGQLQRTLPGISQRELTKRLREFEQCGIVRREVFPQVPPRVEYTLTQLGASLLEPIKALHLWAEQYGPEIHKKQNGSIEESSNDNPMAA